MRPLNTRTSLLAENLVIGRKTLIENIYDTKNITLAVHKEKTSECHTLASAAPCHALLPLLLPCLLPELSSALLCSEEVSGDVRILSRDRGGAPQAGVFCNKRAL